jgi:thiamine-phosphate pyrophosphorylase
MVIRGLYAIAPEDPDTDRLVARVEKALVGGARIVQYRDKSSVSTLKRAQASAILAVCRRYRARLIVNDELELACAIDADGLHLGTTDGDLAAARARLGSDKLLGASCYDDIALARTARGQGVDYVAFGSVFASTTKHSTRRVPLALFTEARREIGLPIVAIGGLTPENAGPVIAAGADAIAVISALFDAPDITEQAERFGRLFPAEPNDRSA